MRPTSDVAGAAIRMVMALGSRLGQEDPADLHYLDRVEAAVRAARQLAVDGQRQHGWSDKDIGEALGMTRQAVQQRWPRTGDMAGSGARDRRR